ncbi:hypothetical protein [Rhodococcus sp. (in: high G+C Gram-positive bacteria)]|uniref:hypothetical protein n=1 Tax=Rhodococcus sp. TaxID=1831 RepID=UPI001A2EEDBD|nr:hypothetical protein [Rhodococcus sp. (in: high G+C Gram-positive bacteria)]MBJ7479242.1 hypothetical protein [Rhodococcus sp. (in: high G+C Gram-positive bacteria)]
MTAPDPTEENLNEREYATATLAHAKQLESEAETYTRRAISIARAAGFSDEQIGAALGREVSS